MEHLLVVVNPALLITYFQCGQSTFLQCYSVVLPKRLISGSVHAGWLFAWQRTDDRIEKDITFPKISVL